MILRLTLSRSLSQERMALCSDNVTDLPSGDGQGEKTEATNAVKTFICQSTIIPATGRGLHTALSSQSINLANTFLGRCNATRCYTTRSF